MVLAHLCPNTTYYSHYAERDDYVIIDNGEAEGKRVPDGTLVDWAVQIQADEVVVPDVSMDVEQTIERARDFQKNAHPRFKYMGVIQGTNMSEWLKCINAFDALGYIDTLAFPRNMGHRYKQQRYNLLESLITEGYLAGLSKQYEIHCLGSISAWIREVVALAELPVVRSMDTSAPAVYALLHCPINGGNFYSRSDTPGFFNLQLTQGMETMYDRNIATYFDWAGYNPIEEASASAV